MEHIQEAIARTNQLHPPTPEISDLAISQLPIETKHRVIPKIEPQSKMSDSKGHVIETFKVKSPRSTANSRHSKLSGFSSLSSSILMQQRAKAEAARAKLKFAKQEANLQRELFVLAAQKEAAVAEAVFNAMLEDEEESASEDLSEIHQERTMSYVNEQNPALRTSELTPSQRSPALPQPNHLGSLEPQQGQVNQMEPLQGQFTLTEPTSGQIDISASSDQRITDHKSTPVNPYATPFVPRTLASRLVNQPTQSQDENHGTTSELIKFLLKKDLLMSRFSNFSKS